MHTSILATLLIAVTSFSFAAPEIGIEQPGGTELQDNTGALGFFTLEIGDTRTKTLTIHNGGNTALTLGTITLGGTDSADFSVGTPAENVVAAYSSTTLDVTFEPLTTGDKEALLTIASDDADENPFEIALDGIAVEVGAMRQVAYIKAPIASNSAEQFGAEIEIDGDYLVARHLDGYRDPRVYKRTGNDWEYQQTLPRAAGTHYIDYEMAIDDDTIAVSQKTIYGDGRVQIFRRVNESWAEEQTVGFPDPLAIDPRILYTSLSGDFLVASFRTGDGQDPYEFPVVVYKRTNNTWAFHSYLTPNVPLNPGEIFGPQKVRISGNLAAVLTYRSGGESSRVFLYRLVDSNWVQEDIIDPSKFEGGEWKIRPEELALDGGTLVVCLEHPQMYHFPVAAMVNTGASWEVQQIMASSTPGHAWNWGKSFDIEGDVLVVGANQERGGSKGLNGNPYEGYAYSSGSANVFIRSGETWTHQAYLKASNTDEDDKFGEFVAVSGDTVAIGALGEDSASSGINNDDRNNRNGSYTVGAVYVFAGFGPPTTLDLDSGSDSGSSDSDDLTKLTEVTLSGFAARNSTVSVSSDLDGSLGQATVGSDGTWSLVTSTLSEGTHSLIASSDAGRPSDPLAVVVDTTPPSSPSAPDLAAGDDQGPYDFDDITNDTSPTFSGTAPSGTTVNLTGDIDGLVGSSSADGGNWTISTSGLTPGIQDFSATASDPAGNESGPSSSLAVQIDTTAPTATVNQAAGQLDPVMFGPVLFTATFSESVWGFESSDVTVSGNAGGAAMVSGGQSTYSVEVATTAGEGFVEIAISGNVATDLAGNSNSTSTSTDNRVDLDSDSGGGGAPTILTFSSGSTTSFSGYLPQGDSDTFHFTLSEPRNVVINTTGPTDTYGILKDSTGATINDPEADNDAGENLNFEISEELPAGTYEILIDSPSVKNRSSSLRKNEDGYYELSLTATPLASGPLPCPHIALKSQLTRKIKKLKAKAKKIKKKGNTNKARKLKAKITKMTKQLRSLPC